jgi:hypothetical protein
VTVGLTPAEQIVELADHVQDWTVEALNAAALSDAAWPECPRHLNSHPLQATLVAQEPTWVCPRDQTVLGRIGELSSV